jgi:hypothetical protein
LDQTENKQYLNNTTNALRIQSVFFSTQTNTHEQS